jgi:hypothetical protein
VALLYCGASFVALDKGKLNKGNFKKEKEKGKRNRYQE